MPSGVMAVKKSSKPGVLLLLAGHHVGVEVRDAAGHANVSITSAYLHVAVEDDQVGELFAM